MFVQSNTVKAVRLYFYDRLSSLFSVSEIKAIVNIAVSKRLDLDKSQLLLSDSLRVSESDLLYFRSVVKRLQQNEPAQYIFGDTVFYDLLIKCDNRALIPRPETEEMVDWIVSDFKGRKVEKILDVCTGSGCIALALKSQFKESEVQALDLSLVALNLAKENAELLKLEVDFFEFNVLEKVDHLDVEPNSFDIWVSNPPYIPLKEKALMQKNVLDFEPQVALFVENDHALIFYEAIAKQAMNFLKVGGSLYFELNENYAAETSKLISELGFNKIEIKLDLQGKKRMLKAIKGEN